MMRREISIKAGIIASGRREREIAIARLFPLPWFTYLMRRLIPAVSEAASKVVSALNTLRCCA